MRKKLTISGIVLAMTIALVFLWPSPDYNLAAVEPTLRGLAMPYQSVNLVNWSDGSVGIRILDREGHQLKLALPVSSTSGQTSYDRLFVGAERSSDPGAVEVEFSEDTRRLLPVTMEKYRGFSDSTDVILIRFRGQPKDYARWYWKNLLRIAKGTSR